MLTAKSMLEDKLEGLESRANDYVTKPFHMDELVARVNVQLKNVESRNKNLLQYHDLELDVLKSKLTCIKTNETVDLVCKEFQLLEYFMNNPEQILSKEQIYDKVWEIENEIESNNLEVYLSFLRRKLKAINSNINIKSVWVNTPSYGKSDYAWSINRIGTLNSNDIRRSDYGLRPVILVSKEQIK